MARKRIQGESMDWLVISPTRDENDVWTGHTLALKVDGTLWAWGSNDFGQLGFGEGPSYYPIQVGSDADWKSISSRDGMSFAVKTDGTLWGWGRNGHYSLIYPDGENISSFYNPERIKVLGPWWNVENWEPEGDEWVETSDDTNWSSVSIGSNYVMGIKTDGTLWAWGNNDYGQLGSGDLNSMYYLPSQMGSDDDWLKVVAGDGFTAALKTDGTLWAWGNNDYYQLGMESRSQKSPVKIGFDDDWKDISLLKSGVFALKTDGTLWAWGAVRDETDVSVQNGDFGWGSLGWSIDPSPLTVSYGVESGILLNTDSSEFSGIRQHISGLTIGNQYRLSVDASIYNQEGYISLTAIPSEMSPYGEDVYHLDDISDDTKVKLYVEFTATLSDLDIWILIRSISSGINTEAEFNNVKISDMSDVIQSPIPIDDSTWKSISSGPYHMMGIKTDGTLWGMGYNDYGALIEFGGWLYEEWTQLTPHTDWLHIYTGSINSFGIRSMEDDTIEIEFPGGGGEIPV